MLTHLSQRYNGAEFSRGGGPAAWADRRSFVAFDSLILNLAALPDLPTYAPAIATFFKRQQLLVERGRQADLAAQIARTARLEREIGMDMERERKKARLATLEQRQAQRVADQPAESDDAVEVAVRSRESGAMRVAPASSLPYKERVLV